MAEIGRRIIFDQDGEILADFGEMSGDVLERKILEQIDYIDIPYGTINYFVNRITGIDVATKQPILEEIPVILTAEQQRIQELEAENASLREQLNSATTQTP